MYYLTFALLSIIMGVFETGFLIKAQWKSTISAPVLTATAAWLKVSSPPKVLVFLPDLGGGPSLSQIYHLQKNYCIHTGVLGNTTWLKSDLMLVNVYLYMWQAGATSVVGVSAERSPEINCCFFTADWCLLPSKRLSGSLELLGWVPDERDVTQRLFLNMMELSSISISSSVYLMRQWDKEIPECSFGGLWTAPPTGRDTPLQVIVLLTYLVIYFVALSSYLFRNIWERII